VRASKDLYSTWTYAYLLVSVVASRTVRRGLERRQGDFIGPCIDEQTDHNEGAEIKFCTLIVWARVSVRALS
jgi:hypothetical protein